MTPVLLQAALRLHRLTSVRSCAAVSELQEREKAGLSQCTQNCPQLYTHKTA